MLVDRVGFITRENIRQKESSTSIRKFDYKPPGRNFELFLYVPFKSKNFFTVFKKYLITQISEQTI